MDFEVIRLVMLNPQLQPFDTSLGPRNWDQIKDRTTAALAAILAITRLRAVEPLDAEATADWRKNHEEFYKKKTVLQPSSLERFLKATKKEEPRANEKIERFGQIKNVHLLGETAFDRISIVNLALICSLNLG